MRRSLVALAAWAALPAAHAAGLYGSLTVDGMFPKAPLPIALFCRGQLVASGTVDTRGSYSLGSQRVPSPPCELRAGGAAASVVLYPTPTRYTFALTHGGGTTRLLQK